MHDFRRGFQASAFGLITSALVALPFSGGFAIVAALALNPASWILVLSAGAIQSFATFWIAGWWLRRHALSE